MMGTSWTPAAVHSVRKNLINALKLDRVMGNQPVKLRYRGALSTKPVEFNAVYDTGLELLGGGGSVEQTAVRLICYDPYAYEVGEASATVGVHAQVSDSDYGMKRIAGVWSNINTAFNGVIYAYAKAPDGCIYIGGAFTNVGDANGDSIVKYNPLTGAFTSLVDSVSAVGGTNGTVYAIAVAPNGDLIIGGTFTLAGNVANTERIAYWDGTNWLPFSTGIPGGGYYVSELVLGQDGTLYVGGNFLDVGDASGDYIVKRTSTAWVSMGTGLNGVCSCIALAPNGYIYVTGSFALAGGVANTAYVAYWNGSAWLPMSTGLAGGTTAGIAIACDLMGRVYVGGDFTSAGGVSAFNAAVWGGASWSPLGAGVTAMTKTIACTSDGRVYFGAQNFFSEWNGYTWSTMPVTLPGANPIVWKIYPDGNDLFIGTSTTGVAYTTASTTITNNGTARAYPVLHIKVAGGGATVYYLRNETTGATVYLSYVLQAGEELILDFRLGQRRVYSSYYGTVWRAVLRGSEFSEFYLQPGANTILAETSYDGGVATLTEYMLYTVTHEGADGAAA